MPRTARGLRFSRATRAAACGVLLLTLVLGGCAKYNTFFNARRAFEKAELIRENLQKQGKDVTQPSAQQIGDYQQAVRKCQIILDEYAGSGLTDDALFLMAKSYHRLGSYRMSVEKFDLLFQNFPNSEYQEEALFLQALNHMLIGDVAGSNRFLGSLADQFPESRFRGEVARVGGRNSFELERWEEARDQFARYLASASPGADTGEVGRMHAECLWELGDFAGAEARLDSVLATEPTREHAFRADLLRSRCLTRLGRYEEAAERLSALMAEAEVYQAQGAVRIAEADNLVAQGKDDEAAPLLENMPDTWRGGAIGPRANDVLGYIYLRAWRLEEAAAAFRNAIRSWRELDDPDRSRTLDTELSRYLVAEQRLDSAREGRAPALKLTQANILLMTLDRPRLALDRYLEVAAAENDSLAAVRGLYGAHLIYGQYLDLPDSAALVAETLRERFPDSPHAHMLAAGEDGDLMDFLLARKSEADALRRAAAMAGEDSAAAAVVQAPADSVAAAPVVEAPADSVAALPVVEAPADSVAAAPVVEAPADSAAALPVVETSADSAAAAPVVEAPDGSAHSPSEPVDDQTPAEEPEPASTDLRSRG